MACSRSLNSPGSRKRSRVRSQQPGAGGMLARGNTLLPDAAAPSRCCCLRSSSRVGSSDGLAACWGCSHGSLLHGGCRGWHGDRWGCKGLTLPSPSAPCRTQAEMAHTCRGTINLSTAHIDTEDSCNIVLSNGGRTYHLKATSEVERQRWVTALELAKAKAIRMRNNQSGRVRLGVPARHRILLKTSWYTRSPVLAKVCRNPARYYFIRS